MKVKCSNCGAETEWEQEEDWQICEYCFSDLVVEDEKAEGNRKFIWKRCSNKDCGESFLFVEYLWQLNEGSCHSFQVVASG